jgi:hypothetical protein
MSQFKLTLQILITLLAFSAIARTCHSESPDTHMNWACVMSGQETEIKFPIDGESGNETYRWKLMKQQRTLAIGNVVVDRKIDGLPTTGTVSLVPPDVPAGTALRLSLHLQTDSNSSNYSSVRRLIVLSSLPFAHDGYAANATPIALFDPNGQTRSVLKDAGVPTDFVRDLTAMDRVSEGILIVGEGTVLDRYRGLGSCIFEAMDRGVDVICLVPANGTCTFPMPIKCVKMKDNHAIGEIDNKLDLRSWQGVDPISKLFAIETSDDSLNVTCRTASTAIGWPWIEMSQKATRQKTIRSKGGTLTMVGFGIIQHWERGPVPRHLLHGLIESKR